MPIADTNSVGLYRSAETAWGETPSSPTMLQMRYTGGSLERKKESVQSEIIRDDRMRDVIAEVGYKAEGDINIELAFGSYDLELEALLGSSFTTTTRTATTLACNTAGTITDSGNGLATFTVGQYIKATGFANAANNIIYRITTVAAGAIGVSPAPAANGTAGPSVTLTGTLLRNGVVKKSILYEKRYTDLSNTFEYFNGCRVGALKLDIAAQSLIKGSFSLIGKGVVTGSTTVAGSTVSAVPNDVLSASANVGFVTKNNTALTTGIRNINLEIMNNLREQTQIGQKELAGVGYGFTEIKGSIEAYFDGLTTFYADVINHTAISLSWRLTDTAGNVMVFTIPRLRLMTGAPSSPSGNQDVVLKMDFAAERDPVTNCMFQIDKIAA